MTDSLDLVKRIAIVALTAYGIRWLFGAKSAQTPKIQGDLKLYEIKWQMRAVAYACPSPKVDRQDDIDFPTTYGQQSAPCLSSSCGCFA